MLYGYGREKGCVDAIIGAGMLGLGGSMEVEIMLEVEAFGECFLKLPILGEVRMELNRVEKEEVRGLK